MSLVALESAEDERKTKVEINAEPADYYQTDLDFPESDNTASAACVRGDCDGGDAPVLRCGDSRGVGRGHVLGSTLGFRNGQVPHVAERTCKRKRVAPLRTQLSFDNLPPHITHHSRSLLGSGSSPIGVLRCEVCKRSGRDVQKTRFIANHASCAYGLDTHRRPKRILTADERVALARLAGNASKARRLQLTRLLVEEQRL